MRFCSSHVLHLLILFLTLNLLSQQSKSATNETDRLALLKFRQGITRDPNGVFGSWNDSSHFCNWLGVSCSRSHQRVASLVLQGKNLIGSISPYVGNLSFLRTFDLQNNSLHGRIPSEIGNLFRLRRLRLQNNSLGGEIPVNLSRCSQLSRLVLEYNNLSGKIPGELGRLPNLEIFSVDANKLSGRIPVSLGNMSSLVLFSVAQNNLVSSIPQGFGRSRNLKYFDVGVNHLSGIVPQDLLRNSSLVTIYMAVNQFHGNLPDDIGLTLLNIREFLIGENNFSGLIPSSLSNASLLEIIDVGANNFVGKVPKDLGNFLNLWTFDLSDNSLGFNSTNDMSFIESLTNCSSLTILDSSQNNFGGILPKSIGNLSKEFTELYIAGNQISGTIPDGIEDLENLIVLSLERNFLTGTIPSHLGKLQKLQGLSFRENKLSGLIPSSIGNLTNLFVLDLSENKLEGTIPATIANCRSLQQMSISHNFLNGSIPRDILRLLFSLTVLNLSGNLISGDLPVEIGKLTNINQLDVSENRLSGEITGAVGECLSLEYLYLQGNYFQGEIPLTLSLLKGLRKLDLSRNNLTGEIPGDLQNLSFMQYLNLSFNDLEGEVPMRGIFRNANFLSLFGNGKLCGGLPVLNLPKCSSKSTRKPKHSGFKLAFIIPSVFIFIGLVVACLLVYKRRKPKKRNLDAPPLLIDPHVEVSYRELHLATSGFSPENFIGSGSFGSVYKGYLESVKRSVAIKVLKLEQPGALKSFMAECKALRMVRHRNLVKLLTYCSSLDYKGNEFKALIFEFMGNGNLEQWLYRENDTSNSSPKSLNFLQRLNIGIDVASALHYLHNLCDAPIIHRDLKPSNILLNDNFGAHVSDFGLAKLFSLNNSTPGEMSSIGVNGTIGYAPPEYGMGGMASKEGDVYSFGIVMLELFSSKKPTDDMFTNGLNLHEFVKNSLPQALVEVVDPTLLSEEAQKSTHLCADKKECLVSILKIGVECSKENPKERMKIADAVKELHSIKSTFLGVRIFT